MNAETKRLQTETAINLIMEKNETVKNALLSVIDNIHAIFEQIDYIYDMAEGVSELVSEYEKIVQMNEEEEKEEKEDEVIPIKEGLFGVVEYTNGEYDTFFTRNRNNLFSIIYNKGGYDTVGEKNYSYNLNGKSSRRTDDGVEVAKIVMLIDTVSFDTAEKIYCNYKLNGVYSNDIVWTRI